MHKEMQVRVIRLKNNKYKGSKCAGLHRTFKGHEVNGEYNIVELYCEYLVALS